MLVGFLSTTLQSYNGALGSAGFVRQALFFLFLTRSNH
nr:MAG TPA: hypothetical protein [Caudoviricetes sp.]